MMTTVLDVQRFKLEGTRFAMLTAYDHLMAKLLDEAGIPILLVGDSLGMGVLGYENTLPVTLEDILHHARAVARGASRALLVADLPFMSYHQSVEQAVGAAGRLLQEGGMHAVKLEGGEWLAPTVGRLTEIGIPVMGHLGLTPQSVHQMGGFKVQGKTEEAAARILSDAHALQEAGAFSIVLEGIPSDLAERVTSELRIPTIGIGAGPACDGQVLVVHDMLGLSTDHMPKFVKRYANLGEEIVQAARDYAREIAEGSFPDAEHSYGKTRGASMTGAFDEVRYGR